ncbi:hypothetical protein, variant 1 [Aphanomyces astaci]|nr:hypothetical protein, variant 1 [Aphanomyces astaci]ETV85196.1 hypothetical protein, variant 1 [Aphanomyces astaci]|eukprot:XP_009825214.1 hypothetical protein, variant 1 [Aphanomyces astaci]
MLQLIRTVLSFYCATRQPLLFPQECFESQVIAEVEMKVLKRKLMGHCKSGQRLHDVVEFGVGECLEHRCLQQYVHVVQDAATHTVLEMLSIDVIDKGGVVVSATDSHENVLAFFRTMELIIETLPPLPCATEFSIDMAFHREKLPYVTWCPPYCGNVNLRRRSASNDFECIVLGALKATDGGLCRVSLQSYPTIILPPMERLRPSLPQRNESWFDMVKAVVLKSTKPTIKHVRRQLPKLPHDVAQWCFQRLVDERVLQRDGRSHR